MSKFSEAVKLHRAVRRAAQDDPQLARELWDATMGEGLAELDSYAEAAEDMLPAEHASLLSSGGVANAFALGCLWERRLEAEQASPHQRREIAREAWSRFESRI